MLDMMASEGVINYLYEDIIQNILGRLPALSFASAACVSKTIWYRLCSRILSHPKLVSALSINPSPIGAITEVLEKVLCQPIRPDFAIACISEKYGLRLVHSRLTQVLGARTPLITHISQGVMGLDTLTDELKEVQWEYFDHNSPHPRELSISRNSNQGIVLVVGFIPGLKVEAIPLFHLHSVPTIGPIEYDKFVAQIKAYSSFVSGGESPSAIMVFGDHNSDVNSILAKLDHSMPEEIAIDGDGGGRFLFNSLNYTITSPDSYILDVVALVFAKDKYKSPGVGETQFHVVKAGGLKPVGPRFQVAAFGVKRSCKCSWVCAKLEGYDMEMTVEEVFEILDESVEDLPDLYIAITQSRRYYSIESQRVALETSTTFYDVIGTFGLCFDVDGVSAGVRPGDTLLFYLKDPETAQATNLAAYDNLDILKGKLTEKDRKKVDNGEAHGVFGGLIFSCNSRGESYFKKPNFDISPFSHTFPGVPVAGVFCKGEIGRGSSRFITKEEHQKQSPPHCCRHAGSAVYLVMSYLPQVRRKKTKSSWEIMHV